MTNDLESKTNFYKYQYKSAREKQIGEFLNYNHLNFEYEKPIIVIDNNKPKIWYPDFHLNDFAILLEYFGINGNTDYINRTKHKQNIYKQNKLDFISLYPEHFNSDNYWQKYIKENIGNILSKRNEIYHKIFRT